MRQCVRRHPFIVIQTKIGKHRQANVTHLVEKSFQYLTFPFLSDRFVGDYSNFPADYAEVSTFSKPPSECSGTRSPAPYATTTLVGNTRLINLKNATNQNMYFTSDLYPQANRCVYSESYFNPTEKINITENRLGCNTLNPNVTMPHSAFGTIRKNRLKLLRNPQFRISFGENKNGCASSPNVSATENQSYQQEQLYVKVGETNPPSVDEQRGMHWMQMSANSSHNSIYENHRQNVDKDVIYAPSGNRSMISCMSSNKRFDDV